MSKAVKAKENKIMASIALKRATAEATLQTAQKRPQ